MNNDIKREENQNCKWSAVFTIRFPKKIDWDWQWQFHHFHFISFHFISFISAKLQPLMIYIQHITVSMNIGYTSWDISKTFLGVFSIIWTSAFIRKHPKLFCLYLSNQISLKGRFVTFYKDNCCSFFTSWVIK